LLHPYRVFIKIGRLHIKKGVLELESYLLLAILINYYKKSNLEENAFSAEALSLLSLIFFKYLRAITQILHYWRPTKVL
jgi:hypothetical protein